MGSGSIEARKGRFRVRLRIAGEKRTIGTYPTREEAERVLQAALDELDKRAASVGTITLRDWIARWLEQRELSGLVRSSTDDASRLRAHVMNADFIDDPLDALLRPVIRAWAVGLLSKFGRKHIGNGEMKVTDRKLSRHTVSHTLATLRVCLRDAVEAGLLDENPATGIRIPAQQYTQEPWTYLTQTEIDLVLNCEAIPEIYRLLFAIAIYTGLRKGELWGLRVTDIYLDHVTPHLMVRRSYKKAPKNGKIRMVPLLEPAQRAFARLLELIRAREEARAREIGPEVLCRLDTGEEVLVWPSRDGVMRQRCDSAHWVERRAPYVLADGTKKVRKDPGYRQIAGILRKVRFHDLRHTCASHLVMGTWGRPWRIEEVRDFLGHADVQTTQRYAHLSPGMLHAAAAETRFGLDDAGPILAPSSSDQDQAAIFNIAQTLEKLRSHLRELNPGPTVYEHGAEINGHASLAAVGATVGPALRERGVVLLRGAAAGTPMDVEAARRLATEVRASVLLAALEAPVLRAAEDVVNALDDHAVASRMIGLATLLVLSEGPQARACEGQTG